MELDLRVLESNFLQLINRLGENVKIIASVKANAYGHGVVPVCQTLKNLNVFAVSTGSFEDAVAIRAAGIETPILMFGGNLPEGIPEYLRYRLTPTVYNLETAKFISDFSSQPTNIYVKVDAGMGRLGVTIEDVETFIHNVSTMPNLIVEGIYTHLSFADEDGRLWSKRGIEKFDQVIAQLKKKGINIPITQAVASSNIMVGNLDSGTAVCPGHLLYGLSPVDSNVAEIHPFQPVLRSVKAQIIHIGKFGRDLTLKNGGYHKGRIGDQTAVVPLGLFDGYRKPREGSVQFVLLRGRRLPVLGISLEHLVFDLLDIKGVEVGEEVVALGSQGTEIITLNDLSNWQGRSSLEVLMNFDNRLDRHYG